MAEGYAITRLSNGLRLVVAPMPDRYSATVAVYVGTGSRYESAAQWPCCVTPGSVGSP